MAARDETWPTEQEVGTGRGGGRNRGQRQERMGGPYSAGPEGHCICPNCGHKAPHVQGQPCKKKVSKM